VKVRRECNGTVSQSGGELHILSPPGSSIEQRSGLNAATEHLFQAMSLSAKLDLVAVTGLRFAAFVLHWEGLPKTFRTGQTDESR
jgi:hypothetical protein